MVYLLSFSLPYVTVALLFLDDDTNVPTIRTLLFCLFSFSIPPPLDQWTLSSESEVSILTEQGATLVDFIIGWFSQILEEEVVLLNQQLNEEIYLLQNKISSQAQQYQLVIEEKDQEIVQLRDLVSQLQNELQFYHLLKDDQSKSKNNNNYNNGNNIEEELHIFNSSREGFEEAQRKFNKTKEEIQSALQSQHEQLLKKEEELNRKEGLLLFKEKLHRDKGNSNPHTDPPDPDSSIQELKEQWQREREAEIELQMQLSNTLFHSRIGGKRHPGQSPSRGSGSKSPSSRYPSSPSKYGFGSPSSNNYNNKNNHGPITKEVSGVRYQIR